MMDDIDRSFDWWTNALKGERGPIDADNPKAGFYRWVWKQKKTMGVSAFWYDSHDGSLRCQVDGRDIDDMRARERWPHDSRRPISQEVFQAFRDTGKFPDVDDAAQADPDIAEAAPEVKAAKELAALKESAKKYAKVESDEEMVKAQSLRAKLQEIAGATDKLRVAEKEPHLEASRAVDSKWQPLIKDAKTTAETIRKAMESWNDFKLEQAARAKALADAKAREAAEQGQASPSPAPVASNAPPPSTQISGGGGRAAHVGVKTVVTKIDIDKCFAHFRDEQAVSDLFFQLAQRAVDAGITVPGVVTEKRSSIR